MIYIDNYKVKIAMANKCFDTVELSNESKVGRTLISKILNGNIKRIKPKSLGMLAKALDVDIEALILEGER